MPQFTLLQSAPAHIVTIIIFALIILFYLLGHAIRARAIKRNLDRKDLSGINGALLALLGLLLAFTFSMSNSRYDTRRSLIVEEANAIGTVIMRTDIYPDSVRTILRANLRDYVEERIAFQESGMDMEKLWSHYRKASEYSGKVWSIAAAYAKVDQSTTIASGLIPALNNMIDITTTRRAAGEGTIPDSIMYFLFALCVCSAFLLGYDLRDQIDWIVLLGFAIMLSLTVFNIIDLDRPRSGLIDMNLSNEKLRELREMF